MPGSRVPWVSSSVTHGEASGTAWTWLSWVRRAAVVVLVVWAVWQMWGADPPTQCREVVARGAAAAATAPESTADLVTQVCAPLSLTSPQVALFGLVVLLLLAPDVSVVEVPGVLRLRRTLDEARAEVGELRSQISAARAEASQSQGQQQVINIRATETGLAQREAETSPERPVPDRGAYSQLAFKAGFEGLTTTLPEWARGASLAGFTVDDGGRYVLSHRTADLSATLVEPLQAAVNDLAGGPAATQVDPAGEVWAVVAPALLDDTVTVGVLAVVVRLLGTPPTPPEAGAAQVEQWVGDVVVAGGAYARLLVDLIGEVGRLDAGQGTNAG